MWKVVHKERKSWKPWYYSKKTHTLEYLERDSADYLQMVGLWVTLVGRSYIFSNIFTTNTDSLCYNNREIKDCISNHPLKRLLQLFLNCSGVGDSSTSIDPLGARSFLLTSQHNRSFHLTRFVLQFAPPPLPGSSQHCLALDSSGPDPVGVF